MNKAPDQKKLNASQIEVIATVCEVEAAESNFHASLWRGRSELRERRKQEAMEAYEAKLDAIAMSVEVSKRENGV